MVRLPGQDGGGRSERAGKLGEQPDHLLLLFNGESGPDRGRRWIDGPERASGNLRRVDHRSLLASWRGCQTARAVCASSQHALGIVRLCGASAQVRDEPDNLAQHLQVEEAGHCRGLMSLQEHSLFSPAIGQNGAIQALTSATIAVR